MIQMRIAAAALIGAFFAQPAAAGQQDFILVNDTGYTIEQVYVSPSRASSWQEDVLGDNVLAEGGRVTIRFDREEDTCLWDLKAVYADGDTAEWQAFNLCEVSVVAIRYDEDTGRTTATYE